MREQHDYAYYVDWRVSPPLVRRFGALAKDLGFTRKYSLEYSSSVISSVVILRLYRNWSERLQRITYAIRGDDSAIAATCLRSQGALTVG